MVILSISFRCHSSGHSCFGIIERQIWSRDPYFDPQLTPPLDDKDRLLHQTHIVKRQLPCCGHFMIPNETLDNVTILGCPNGIDWSVIHDGNLTSQISFLLAILNIRIVP